ncbi:cobalt ABC transporter ATP-binding protein [Desulfosarcina ovata subsp. sediminis]|uniref:Cobalt ABC transporter ATP-binding protein n=1 Tax=Desulfosarcina ovata subsp. sediminis TaxID=885957 RepID=A0A5K7ZR85_9BACT|nr:ABC transporter ATP-binding protein [Desulfosarcina ovata]BBO80753.1 cobalt ABC transporter ATP-binding protein [Desulfosarcina ovata subsp. sediminis]
MSTVIQTDHLTHRFADGTLALDDVSLAFKQGELTVVAGANGSGKTTLLRHLNGLLTAQHGSVRVCGRLVKKDPLAARKAVGMVFQDADSQIVGETVYDDAAFGPENLGLDRPEIDRRVERALAVVDLAGLENKRPHHLSGGQKRRLAIAGVLAMEPQVLLMDEPFSNLDYPATRRVLEQILDLDRRGHTIIITTHDLEKIIAHARRLVVMAKGRVVDDGRPETVIGGIARHGIRPPCSVQLGKGIRPWVN